MSRPDAGANLVTASLPLGDHRERRLAYAATRHPAGQAWPLPEPPAPQPDSMPALPMALESPEPP